MTELVALDLPGGEAFVRALRRAWDGERAVLVVDQRLPAPARRALFAAARPHVVVDGTEGSRRGDDPGPGLEPGDALVVATSGSSGDPKLVVHTRAGLLAHAQAVHRRLAVDPERDRWLACLPLSHLGGFGVVARALLTGTPCTVVAGFAPDVVADAAEAGCTLTSLVPSALDQVDAGAFRWVVLGGAADRTERPANVVRTYGLTESGGGVVYDGMVLDGTEVRVVDGRIHLRGPTLARGILGTDGIVHPVVDHEGWLATGDLGHLDAGRLEVIGRADELIVTGGENVWPEPVEGVLRAHPGVADAAVVGAPDDRWGERVVAIVVPTDPGSPPSLDALRDHVRASLPAAAAPWELRLVAALPRTSLGKLQRGSLRAQ